MTAMDPQFVAVVLFVLTISVALNFLLTLRLAAIVSEREYERLPLAMPAGTPLPAFSAIRTRDRLKMTSDTLRGSAAIIVFMSPGCGECRARLVELAAMHAAIARAGVTLWMIATGNRRQVAEFLQGTPLLDHAMEIDKATGRKLNPRTAAPFYLFVDDGGIVLASNFIGDADWLSFCEQMKEYGNEEMS
jgi:Redoxin